MAEMSYAGTPSPDVRRVRLPGILEGVDSFVSIRRVDNTPVERLNSPR